VQDPAFALVELHQVPLHPALQPVQVLLKVIALSKGLYSVGELGVLVRLPPQRSRGGVLTATHPHTLQGQLCGCCTLLSSPSGTLDTQRLPCLEDRPLLVVISTRPALAEGLAL